MNRTITQLIILARTFADELENMLAGPAGIPVDEAIAQIQEDTKPKRTRGPNKPKETAAPVGTAVPAEPAAPAEEPAAGMTLAELQSLIEAPVKAGKGASVKQLITDHGGTQLSNLPAANHAAFKADVEALVY